MRISEFRHEQRRNMRNFSHTADTAAKCGVLPAFRPPTPSSNAQRHRGDPPRSARRRMRLQNNQYAETVRPLPDPHGIHARAIGDGESVEKMKIRNEHEISEHVDHALDSRPGTAMMAAIEIVDDIFERGYSEEHPEVLVAFMTFAGHAFEVRAKVDCIH